MMIDEGKLKELGVSEETLAIIQGAKDYRGDYTPSVREAIIELAMRLSNVSCYDCNDENCQEH